MGARGTPVSRRRRRENIRRVAGDRRAGSDEVFGIRVESLERGIYRGRLRWSVDREPFYALPGLVAVRGVLDALELDLVAELRAEGVSWEDLGFLLGITGEGARKRFGAQVGGARARSLCSLCGMPADALVHHATANGHAFEGPRS